MAKEETKKLTPEEQQAEKERLERLKKEEKELKLKAKEKEKKRKEREKKIRVKEKKEEKRIRGIVNFPIKTLLQLSVFFTSVAFLIIYFGNGLDLEKAIYICSLLFILMFFTVGAVMVIGYWKISDERIKDMESKKKREKEEEDERLRREEEELERLLKEEIDDEDDIFSSDSKLLDKTGNEDGSMIPEINFEALNDELSGDDSADEEKFMNDYNDNNDNESDFGTNNSEESNALSTGEEPAPFFSEDDFMNEVIFGANDKNEKN